MTMTTHMSRNAGLAFVVGAGIALGIGSAGSAAAAPDSTAESVGSAVSSQAPVRGQRHSAAPKPARTSDDRPRSVVRTVAASNPVRRAPSPAIPVSVPAVDSPATTPAPPVASAVGAARTCQRTITILPGIPLGLPALTVPWVKKVNGIATFTPKSVYDLHNADQFDWNKLTGIGFSIPGDVNSSMVAWRYNTTSGDFEIAPFFNVDKARILPSQDEIIAVPIGEPFDFTVNYDGVTISYGDRTVFKPTPEGLTPNFWTSYRVSVWFGGTSLPPNVIKVKLGFTH